MDRIANLLKEEVKTSTKQRIYTTSFCSREVTDLPGLLTALEAVLIDIRFAPEKMPLRWSKDYLRLLLKNRYLHVPSLGNRASKQSRKIAIQNLNLGIKIITELKINVLLICSCEREDICHRRKIREKLIEQGIQTQELLT
jgi:uncharacterized protein (DUF488 family)